MKSIKTIILSIIALAIGQIGNAQISAAMKAPTSITINGKIEGAGNAKVTLEKIGVEGIYEETTAKNGVFKIFSKKTTMPYPFKLTVGDKSMIIMLESNVVTITGKISDLQNSKVEGLSSHNEYMTLHNAMAKCSKEIEKEMAMEDFMSKNSHSWVSMYCLEYLYAKHPEATQKIRNIMKYVEHYKHSDTYKNIDKAITKIEESEN